MNLVAGERNQTLRAGDKHLCAWIEGRRAKTHANATKTCLNEHSVLSLTKLLVG
jgi:hypothetical protein